MFKNGKSKPKKPSGDVTVINRGTTVEGEVDVEGTIRVYGRLNGTIRSEGKVVVAEDGILSGDLYAEAADVSGTVEGLIEATRLDLRETATVEGQVVVEKFTAETGAVFIGDCKMPQNGTLLSESAPKTSSEDTKVDGAAGDDATDENGESNEETAEQTSSEAKQAEEAAPAASADDEGVKPLPNKPHNSEPQAENASASDQQESSTRPRLW